MYLKLLGSLMLLTGSVAAGLYKAKELSDRVKVLYGLQDALLSFENEIRYRLAPMSEALCSAASSDISGIFKGAAECLPECDATAAMKHAAGTCSVSGEERAALMSFAEGLSAGDAEGQIKNALLCRERIQRILKDAEDRKKRLYKLYCISGGVSGAALLLLII